MQQRRARSSRPSDDRRAASEEVARARCASADAPRSRRRRRRGRGRRRATTTGATSSAALATEVERRCRVSYCRRRVHGFPSSSRCHLGLVPVVGARRRRPTTPSSAEHDREQRAGPEAAVEPAAEAARRAAGDDELERLREAVAEALLACVSARRRGSTARASARQPPLATELAAPCRNRSAHRPLRMPSLVNLLRNVFASSRANRQADSAAPASSSRRRAAGRVGAGARSVDARPTASASATAVGSPAAPRASRGAADAGVEADVEQRARARRPRTARARCPRSVYVGQQRDAREQRGPQPQDHDRAARAVAEAHQAVVQVARVGLTRPASGAARRAGRTRTRCRRSARRGSRAG